MVQNVSVCEGVCQPKPSSYFGPKCIFIQELNSVENYPINLSNISKIDFNFSSQQSYEKKRKKYS